MAYHQDKSDHPDASDLNHEAYMNGVRFYKQKEYARAKILFEEALKYWSEDPQAWFALGNCHDAMNKPNRAEVCYLMSLKYSPKEAQPGVYYNLGNAYFDQGNYQKAVDCYKRIGSQCDVYCSAQKNLKLATERLS